MEEMVQMLKMLLYCKGVILVACTEIPETTKIGLGTFSHIIRTWKDRDEPNVVRFSHCQKKVLAKSSGWKSEL